MKRAGSTIAKLSIAYFALFSVAVIGCKKNNNQPTEKPAPDAAFTYTSVRKLPVTVVFNNTSTSATSGSTYVWDFGDGSSSTRPNPSHEYTQQGNYVVKLSQRESNGNTDTIIKVITIPASGNGPSGSSSRLASISTANFTFDVLVGYTVTFTNTSKNADTYFWNFGDGLNSTSAAPTVTHDYVGAGPFVVKLNATGPGGTDSCKATIHF
jgi:PKD repeat protein